MHTIKHNFLSFFLCLFYFTWQETSIFTKKKNPTLSPSAWMDKTLTYVDAYLSNIWASIIRIFLNDRFWKKKLKYDYFYWIEYYFNESLTLSTLMLSFQPLYMLGNIQSRNKRFWKLGEMWSVGIFGSIFHKILHSLQ